MRSLVISVCIAVWLCHACCECSKARLHSHPHARKAPARSAAAGPEADPLVRLLPLKRVAAAHAAPREGRRRRRRRRANQGDSADHEDDGSADYEDDGSADDGSADHARAGVVGHIGL